MLFASMGLDPLMVAFGTILTSATIGGILWLMGLWDKIQEFGEFGAILPLCGLSAALAGMYCGVRSSGKTAGQSYIAVWTFFFKVLGLGILTCCVIGAVVSFVAK